MTLEPWMIYLVALADKLIRFFGVAVTALLTAGALCALAVPLFDDAWGKKENVALLFAKKYFKTWLITLIAISTIPVIVPSSKVLAAMYVLPPIVNSAAVQELPAELVELARAHIKDTINSLKEKGE